MTEKRVDMEELQKALSALKNAADLAKSETATTRVESMTGESGSSQLFHTPSNSDPGSWAGSTWKGESWEDMIAENGTDLQSVKKFAKSVMDKLSKGEALQAGELDFVNKGGLNFLNQKEDDKDKDKDKDVSKAQAHKDEKADRKLVEEMVRPEARKDADVKKSLMDHALESTDHVVPGFEMSSFLADWAQVMHKSMASMEARVVDQVLTTLSSMAEEQGTVQKSLAEALTSLGDVLAVHSQRLNQVESTPARGPKSQAVVKSISSPLDGPADDISSLTKSQINDRLYELVQKSQATSADVLRFDSTGELRPDLADKVMKLGR